MESLRAMGSEELERLCARASGCIRENGITYNIYDDPLGANRSWKIDIVPLLISANEWRYIEAGIIQRAHLLNLLPRRFLRAAGFDYGRTIPCRFPLCQSRISAAAGRRESSAAKLSPYAGSRSGPLSRWTVVGAGRSYTGTVRERICT